MNDLHGSSFRAELTVAITYCGLGLFLGLLAGAPMTARACWDGRSVGVGRVSLAYEGGGWDVEDARDLGVWALRIQALLPADRTLNFGPYDELNICELAHPETCSVVLHASLDPPAIFELVAALFSASPSQRARARSLDPPLYVVQVGSFASRPRADRLAESIQAEHISGRYYEAGFYNADGGPSFGTAAHVTSTAIHSRHRVVVGLFLDHAEAHRVARDMARFHPIAVIRLAR